jgi:anhydro-N-acetylmuramic acid kinase
MANQQETFGIGVMSGTSLDGMDIAYCKFNTQNNPYSFQIIAAETYSYSPEWIKKLSEAHTFSGESLSKLNIDFGNLTAVNVNFFIEKNDANPSFISSHGHTIFHQPENGFTLQIGSGAEITANTNIQTICDFRTNDIALKGQGAPLVPIGDNLLFSQYDACINLGGFANISYTEQSKRIAFDICPVNIVLNYYTKLLGLDYDNEGEIAAKSQINNVLLEKLNKLSFYNENPPKSLGREWITLKFIPIVDQFEISIEEKIATLTEHAAQQIALSLTCNNVLITGGGTYNKHLIQSIKKHTSCQLIIPNSLVIDFKEALIFAFLGLLRSKNSVNCLKSATGALRNNIGGCIYIP